LLLAGAVLMDLRAGPAGLAGAAESQPPVFERPQGGWRRRRPTIRLIQKSARRQPCAARLSYTPLKTF
jgi:hypothetical protein